MASFNIPASPSKYTVVVDTFRGVDLLNSPTNVEKSRSPAAPNMIRDQVGKVRKRMGYQTVATAPEGARVNGVHFLGEERLLHAGAKLYRWEDGDEGAVFTELGAMADARSVSFRFDDKLYLLDGTEYRVYDGSTLAAVSAGAYVPTVVISRNPTGGGTAYEALNLLGTKWRESFLGTAEATVYQLTADGLDETPVTAEVLDADGEWVAKTEGTDFTVDREKGTVTFSTAPGVSPVTGHDNVRITASKAREGYGGTVSACTVFAVYGVGGAADRVFLSGNAAKPGTDWYSAYDDPAYIPDTNYTRLSRDGSQVAGYAILNNTLATFLRGSTDGRSVVVRTGSLDGDGEALFRITNTLIGEDAAAPGTFALAGKEPLFLTERGVYAITAEELTGEKYSQERSYYISTALEAAEGKAGACAIVWRDFYVLALEGVLYLLDLRQRSYEKNSPYSSFQYECYYFPGIPARVLFQDGEALCFGQADGKLRRFGTNVDDPSCYNDDGAAIDAYWEFSDFDGQTFFRAKTFTGISVRLASAVLTGVRIFAQKQGLWSQVFDAKERARYLDWGYIDFAKFVFSADRTPRTLWGKIKLKKVDKVRFRLQNNALNEPFGLYAFGLEWKEPGGNYKR